MKNLIGLYPGTVYGTVPAGLHDHAAAKGSAGVAYEILDMVRADKLGLVVVDGSTAMEGNGPGNGTLVDVNLIVAGANPLATWWPRLRWGSRPKKSRPLPPRISSG
jgi:uncharacterized protein (DUF362 family)